MAEGDTIVRAARRLRAAIGGETVAASAPNPRGRAARIERLDGHTLNAIETHGKHLIFDFGELVLHSHLGMSGGWHVYPKGARWRRPRRSAWAVLSGPEQDAVQFGGPTLEVWSAARARRDPKLLSLGPDILAEEFELDAVMAAFRADPGRTLGDALLDQHLTAGIGNIFKSEACFKARIDPWRTVGDLSDPELEAVLLAAREEMLDAVEVGRKRFAVYKHRGPCSRCRGPVRHRGQGDDNRTTWWCARCQT